VTRNIPDVCEPFETVAPSVKSLGVLFILEKEKKDGGGIRKGGDIP
jgi:hypothetical protein